jgi:hypothetical protein
MAGMERSAARRMARVFRMKIRVHGRQGSGPRDQGSVLGTDASDRIEGNA